MKAPILVPLLAAAAVNAAAPSTYDLRLAALERSTLPALLQQREFIEMKATQAQQASPTEIVQADRALVFGAIVSGLKTGKTCGTIAEAFKRDGDRVAKKEAADLGEATAPMVYGYYRTLNRFTEMACPIFAGSMGVQA